MARLAPEIPRLRQRAAAAVLVVALVIRVGAVVATPDYKAVADPGDYARHAQAIQHGHWPARPGGQPGATAYRPPLYPVFLGVAYRVSPGSNLFWSRIAQALLGTLSVWLTGVLAALLFGRRTAVWAMAITAVWPPVWIINAALLSENVMVPLVLGMAITALLARRSGGRARLWWCAATGVLAGLGWLTRANGFSLLLPLAIALWPSRGQRRTAATYAGIAVLIAASVLTIAPWTARNAHALHRFVPVSTEDGYTLAGTYNPVARAQKRFPAAWVEWYRVPQNLAALRGVPNTEVDQGDALRSRALRDARKHPGYVVKVGWWNLRRVFDAAGIESVRNDLAGYGLPRSWAWLEFAAFWLVALIALAGVVRRSASGFPVWLALMPPVLLLPVLVTGYLRFRAPIDPLIAILAALALLGFSNRESARGDGEVAGGRLELPTSRL